MQHPENDQLPLGRQIINCIMGMKHHAQVQRKLFALCAHERGLQERIKLRLDRTHEPRRDIFRRFGCNISPDFREIGLRGVG